MNWRQCGEGGRRGDGLPIHIDEPSIGRPGPHEAARASAPAPLEVDDGADVLRPGVLLIERFGAEKPHLFGLADCIL